MRYRTLRLLLITAVLVAITAIGGCALGVSGVAPGTTTAVPKPTSPLSAIATPVAEAKPVTFAVIGDYGMDDANERAVADLVASWNPAFVITTGDDYYSPAGGSGTGNYDESTGAYYGTWLKDISTTGARSPMGLAAVNAFFPALGNHDYTDATPSLSTYLTYFTLPGTGFTSSSGNERYYDYVQGPVHFFVLNSNTQEPDGVGSTSTQALWLKTQLAASTSRWNIVYEHHPPYSSDSSHGSTTAVQWPFATWGADAVISGHAHTYERVMRNGIVYFVNGLGGAGRYDFTTPVTGSAVRYRSGWGAQKVTVTDARMDFEFYNVNGTLIDSYSLPSADVAKAASAARITRYPARPTVTHTRRHGVAKFTISALVRTADGAPASGRTVYLQSSKNGKTGWRNSKTLVANTSGKVSRAFKVRKRATVYYRWYAPATAETLAVMTRKQKVVVR